MIAPIRTRAVALATCLGAAQHFSSCLGRPLAIGLFLAVPLAGCESAQERAVQKAQLAQDYFAAGNLLGADRAITEAIQLRDDKPDYFMLKGVISLKSGRPSDAFNNFNRALDLDGSNVGALSYVANIGVQIGRIADAQAAADKLLVLDPESVPALQVKGMIALSKDKLDEATGYGDRILARSPTDEAGTIIKARAIALAGKHDEALAIINGAIAATQETPALVSNKLNIYRAAHRPQEMVPLLARLVQLTGGSITFRLDQINTLYKLGQADAARAATVSLLTAGSATVDDYAILARLWDQYDPTPVQPGAVDAIAKAKDRLAVITVVRHLLRRGDVRTADAILAATPPNIEDYVASLKARVAFAKGDKAGARQMVDRILDKDANDVDALLLRSQFNEADGKDNLAINDAQQAQAADPFDPETYQVLAGIYDRRGEEWRTRQVLEDGIKRLPQNYYLMERYVGYLRAKGDRSRAVSSATSFARAQPSAVRAWQLLMSQCVWANDRLCGMMAQQGGQAAAESYKLDPPYGMPPNRGLFGPL